MPASLFLRFIVFLFRFLPFRGLYVLSNGLAFFLQYVIGYRKQVIYDNLRRCFPEKSEEEIRKIIRGTYRNLTDVTLETLKSNTASLDEISRRCRLLNLEIVAEYLDRGQSVILAASHNSNWEYCGLVIPPLLNYRLCAVYKPLTNKVVDKYVNQMRSRNGIHVIPMDDVVGVMRKQRNKEAWAYILIADQSPSSRKRAQWVDFFGQETAMLPGLDVLSRMFDFPVISYRVKRVRRGFYELEYEPLCTNPSAAKEGDITRAYVERLEEEIRMQPENWLWSHKRWKMHREA